jgi:hypothetical protein
LTAEALEGDARAMLWKHNETHPKGNFDIYVETAGEEMPGEVTFTHPHTRATVKLKEGAGWAHVFPGLAVSGKAS